MSRTTEGARTADSALPGRGRRAFLHGAGVAAGLVGYALGNYAGLGVAAAIRPLIGG